ncbi:MAG: hypothetical protein EAS52_12015 [Parapedobacter sp.]|nr:MAG: hypothetical protein EAS52_12015 [Parapedobacter sp.]
MNVIDRAQAPTPKFFKAIRSVGLVIAAAGAAILTAPVALPAAIVTVGGYLTVAGSVLSAISQVTVDDNRKKENTEETSDE